MRTFIGPDIILSDLTEGPTLFAQSALFLMLVIKSELYDVIPCTSLGIVPVHYTFMYMDEREQQIGENTDIVDFSL